MGYPPDTPPDHITQEHFPFVHLVCPAHVMDNPCDACGRRVHHIDCIVIAVDGVCPNNGKRNNLIFSPAGVHVGLGNELSGGYTLIHKGATHQTAELQAGIKGLEIALCIVSEDLPDNTARMGTLVIKTDSKYVFEGITDHIKKWKLNGWQTASKKPVANKELWLRLAKTVEKVEN